MTMRKVGGIWFWKIGRLGGSFYIAKPKARVRYHATEPSHRLALALCWGMSALAWVWIALVVCVLAV